MRWYDDERNARSRIARRSCGPDVCNANCRSPPCSTNAAIAAGSPLALTSRSPTAGKAARSAAPLMLDAVRPAAANRCFQYADPLETARAWSRTSSSCSLRSPLSLRRSQEVTRAKLPGAARASALALLDLIGQLRDDVEQVAHNAEIDQLEDRGLGVLVDGHDRLRRLHTGPVLDGTGDADRHVELRRYGLARLADLVGVRVPAGVGRGTRRTDRSTEGVGELFDDVEVLAIAETTATGDDDRRLGELRTSALLLGHPVEHLGLLRRVGQRHRDLLLGRLRRCRLGRGGVGTHGDDRRALAHLRLHVERTTEDALRRDEPVGNTDRVGDDTGLELYCQPAGDLLALRRARDEHRGGRGLLHDLREHLRLRRDEVGVELSVAGDVDLRRAVLRELLLRVVRSVADEHRRGLTE